MEQRIELNFTRTTFNRLKEEDRMLIESAKENLINSYAPYSGFYVAASILLENGIMINGSNQENIAYPSGLCAERVALFFAGSNYPKINIKTIAISAKYIDSDINDIISPCGACRQVMAEYQQKQNTNIRVILHSENNEVLISESVENFLPLMFKYDKLRKF